MAGSSFEDIKATVTDKITRQNEAEGRCRRMRQVSQQNYIIRPYVSIMALSVPVQQQEEPQEVNKHCSVAQLTVFKPWILILVIGRAVLQFVIIF